MTDKQQRARQREDAIVYYVLLPWIALFLLAGVLQAVLGC